MIQEIYKMNFPKPKIVVSKCLGFSKCRYNGQIISDEFVESLRPFVKFITVCPEIEIKLGVPRDSLRIVDGKLIQTKTEKDFSDKINKFSDDFLNSLKNIDGFILKNRSPSCGIGDVRIYGKNNRVIKKSNGFFGDKVLKKFPDLPIEDEGRLRNFKIREHFLIKLFTLTNFKKINSIKKLNDFHEHNKFLFMAYSQVLQKKLGKIVAHNTIFQETYKEYKCVLEKLLNSPCKTSSTINSLNHIYSHFHKKLNQKEKKYFLENIEEFKNKNIPLSTLTHLLYSWALRFNDNYLVNQTIFMPYPEELIKISDSGKGRDL